MRKLLKYEIRRFLRSKGFYVSVLLSVLMATIHYIVLKGPILPEVQGDYLYLFYPTSFYKKWIGGESATSIGQYTPILVALISCMPYSASLNNDYSSGIINNLLVCISPLKYVTAKSIVTFVGGGLSGVMPYLISMILNLCTYPLIRMEEATLSSFMVPGILFYNLWTSHPFMYCLLYTMLIFIYSGLIALLGMAMGRIIKKSFIIILFPMIAILVLSNFLYLVGLSAFIPLSVFFPVQIYFSNYFAIPLWIIGLMFVCIILLKRTVIDSDTI